MAYKHLIVSCIIIAIKIKNIYIYIYIYTGASPGFGRGGPRIFFFQIWEFACREATYAAHGEAMRNARGVRGHAPPRKFFKTVQFGAF